MGKKIVLAGDPPSRKVLIGRCDDLFSLLVRYLAGWRCAKCGKQHRELSKELSCSHFWSRGDFGTRWEQQNCDALCGIFYWNPRTRKYEMGSCHGEWEREKAGAYRDFMLKKLGQDGYDILEYKARNSSHFSRNDLVILRKDLQARLDRAMERFRAGPEE